MNLIIISFIWMISFLSPVYALDNLQSVQAVINYDCISPAVIGPCPRPDPPFVGIKIRYWEPVLLAETVKSPGDTTIKELAPFLKDATANTSKALMNQIIGLPVPPSSGSNWNSLSGVSLQFNEAHIYKFPFDFQDIINMALSCPATAKSTLPIIYLSELDSAEWRIGMFEAMSPLSLFSASLGPVCSVVNDYVSGMCMGTWGAVYPRRGFLTHQSEVVASAADIFRAVSIASINDLGLHIKISSVMFTPDSTKDKLQLLSPYSNQCVHIGQNPVSWESQKKSVDGKYLWVYWRYRECCVY